MSIKVVLADDHAIVRQGLRSLLEREKLQVVAEASDGQEAVHFSETLHPDIAVVDISMPTLNGIDAVRQMSRSCPSIHSRSARSRRERIRPEKSGGQRSGSRHSAGFPWPVLFEPRRFTRGGGSLQDEIPNARGPLDGPRKASIATHR